MTAEESIAAKRDQYDLIGNASRTSSFTNSPRAKRSCSGEGEPPTDLLKATSLAGHEDFEDLQDLNSGREEEIDSRAASFAKLGEINFAPSDDFFPAPAAAPEPFPSHSAMAPLPPPAPAPSPPVHDSPASSPIILAHATVQQPAAPYMVPLPSASVMLSQPLKNAVPALARSRKDWSEWEDTTIKQTVAEVGLRWRAIASRLPGRSDDAVRNRWLRLGGEGVHKPATAPRSRKEPGEKQRQGWSAQEDAIIAAAVAEIGNRWNRIVELLPNKRTEHAIRNRWHRLQTAAADGRCTVAPSDLSLPLAPVRSASEGSVGSQLTVEDAVAPLVVCRAYSA